MRSHPHGCPLWPCRDAVEYGGATEPTLMFCSPECALQQKIDAQLAAPLDSFALVVTPPLPGIPGRSHVEVLGCQGLGTIR